MRRRSEGRPGRGTRGAAPESGASRARLPLRKSLFARLLAVSALVAACSVAATAWLAVQTTSGAILKEQGQNLTADARIYHSLLGYAAAHPTWDGVDRTVRALAEQSGRRIALTTEQRTPLADSAAPEKAAALPAQASAIVDPLSVDTALAAENAGPSGTPADRVDPRAVGPFRLPAAERTALRQIADRGVACLSEAGIASDVVRTESGRPVIQVVGNDPERIQESRCTTDALDAPTATEQRALKALNQLADACLKRQDRSGVHLKLDLSWGQSAEPVPTAVPTMPPSEAPRPVAGIGPEAAPSAAPTETPSVMPSTAPSPAAGTGEDDRAIASCVGTARREQLSSYVASPALLFISNTGGTTVPGFDLSPANTARIAGAAALVLALTVGASVLVGARLVRPLRALTGAAQRMRDGEDTAPVRVTADNEIGRLAATFNDMSAHRARLESQRKAMVSDVAHELRTPLSNIRGWLEAAQDGVADPDPAFIASLHEEAVQLQHIIDDLQDLAQADAGALRLHAEPVRIEELLSQVAAAHQARAETAGVALTVPPPSPPDRPVPGLTADPVRLRQAIGNLVSNAVRHTPAGGQVTLRAYGSASGDAVLVDVSDTGTGIPAEDLAHVFDRFWRGEKSRSRRTGGSGLGLAIVRKLTEAHGGTATATSVPGEGSVFTLRLPADRPEHAPVGGPAAAPVGGPGQP
ncbi:sensor histidine kinase [Streptomyces sp. NPDC005780]|uniref:sensor histidine kinase n=1 Tax=Streptomyces sp. NPDC005780 TaxID=3364730 RepID=UPI0036A65AB1